jgi:surface protein
MNMKKIIAKDKEHLSELISEEMKINGTQIKLNYIDVSQIKDMKNLFRNSTFNGDISEWDVSNVVTMCAMFRSSEFNGDISKWNVSKVQDMASMFESSKFDGNISNWDTSSVVSMMWMFRWSEFNQDISKWDVSNLIDISYMFFESKFNQDLSDWTPYRLDMPGAPFSECSAPVPYWAKFDDYRKRGEAIDKYKLSKELVDELVNKNDQSKKIKI